MKSPVETAKDLADQIIAADIKVPEGYEVVIFVFQQKHEGLGIGYISEVTESTLRRWLRIFLRTKPSDKQKAPTSNRSVH